MVVNACHDWKDSQRSRKDTERVEKLKIQIPEPRSRRENQNASDELERLLGHLEDDIVEIVVLVATEAVAVVDGLTNNPNFTAPPITPADLKAQVDIYVSLIAAANDGGKTAIVECDKQRAVVVKILRQLGHWVEANCKEDAGILQSSGYQQASVNRTGPQALDGPPVFKVDNGPNSGQMILRGKPVSKAVSYTVRFAALDADGKPGTWTEQPSTVIRSITVIGLTPGTTYAFQVRALGRLGNTDWSDLRDPHRPVAR